MSGLSLEGVWNVPLRYLENVWKRVWKGSGKGLEGALNVSGRCLEEIWKCSG